MIIHHSLGDILLDDKDADILADWQFLTIQDQGRWKYVILYSEREGGVRKSRYLSRAVMGITDPQMEINYKNRNGLDCRRQNLIVAKKTWRTRKKKHAQCLILKA